MDRETVSIQPSLVGAVFGWILVGHVRRQRHRVEAVLLDIQRRHDQEMLQHEEDMLRARDPEAAARLDVIKAQRATQLARAAQAAGTKRMRRATTVALLVAVAATLISLEARRAAEGFGSVRPTVPAAVETAALLQCQHPSPPSRYP